MSKDGLGAVLMQQGRTIEYAARALTFSERKWAHIEKRSSCLVSRDLTNILMGGK